MTHRERRPEVVNAINRLFDEAIKSDGPVPDEDMDKLIEQYELFERACEGFLQETDILRTLTMTKLYGSLLQDQVAVACAMSGDDA